MFLKKKRDTVPKLNFVLCNKYIQTSKQITDAIKKDKTIEVGVIKETQFSWVAEEEISKSKYDYLFIDYLLDTNRDLGKTLKRIKKIDNNLKVILLTNAYTGEIADFETNELIDKCILMPFQPMYIVSAIKELKETEA